MSHLSRRRAALGGRLPTLVGAVAVLLVTTADASAQQPQLPLCPSGEEIVTTYPPKFVRRGGTYSATIERADAGVGTVDVEFGVSGDDQPVAVTTNETFPFNENSDEIEFLRSSPTSGDTLQLSFSWIQDAGSPIACRGYDRYRDIPVIEEDVKVGDPDFGRFDGRYRISRRTDARRPAWTLDPVCDLFACSSNVRSTAGLKGKFSFDAEVGKTGEYLFEERLYDGYCAITYGNGRTVKWRAYAYRTIKLRPQKVVDGVAVRLKGSERWDYEIPSDEFDLCDAPRSTVERITATRR